MTIIVEPDTLTTAYSAMTTSADGDVDFDDTLANACLTTTTVSTTLSSCSNDRVYAEEARRYVDSLSDDELYRFEQMLSEKEQEIVDMPIEEAIYIR